MPYSNILLLQDVVLLKYVSGTPQMQGEALLGLLLSGRNAFFRPYSQRSQSI